MSIRIVTHCYAATLPQYAVFLRAQLSSLVLFPTATQATIAVCCCPADARTLSVLSDFRSIFKERLEEIHMPPEKLFRRAIGRNLAVFDCKDDIVWFTDVDHYFGSGCLDSLQTAWESIKFYDAPKKSVIAGMWPKLLQIHKTHEMGDAFVKAHLNDRGLLPIDPSDFKETHYRSAIGGVQIVDGDYARTYGYLRNQKRWLRPVSPEKPFPSFTDDVKFRKHAEGVAPARQIEMVGLYRLRHTKTTYKGEVEQVVDHHPV